MYVHYIYIVLAIDTIGTLFFFSAKALYTGK